MLSRNARTRADAAANAGEVGALLEPQLDARASSDGFAGVVRSTSTCSLLVDDANVVLVNVGWREGSSPPSVPAWESTVLPTELEAALTGGAAAAVDTGGILGWIRGGTEVAGGREGGAAWTEFCREREGPYWLRSSPIDARGGPGIEGRGMAIDGAGTGGAGAAAGAGGRA